MPKSYRRTRINLQNGRKSGHIAFHPDKCSTLRISRSKNPHSNTYILKGHALTTEDSTSISRSGNIVQYVMDQAHRPDHQERKRHVKLLVEKSESQ